MVDESVNFQQVFHRHLKELNLSDFPTGDGKWRNNLNWESDLLHSKQYGNLADLFTNESLNELTNHVIFKKNTDWSRSVDTVVTKSIQHPKQKLKNIYSHFKTLRLVNEKINSIDSSISQFENLKELTLTSNNIESLDLNVLPASLQVLELCGNSVSDVDFLCTTPTNLYYIGLGYNSITSLSRLQTASYFNSLLYLDLSFNLLDDLKGSVKALTYIPKLRVLLFQGNPLFLCMGYRGYVIDSLSNLTCLDDTDISPDERQSFKGITEMNLPFDTSMLKIVIDEFQNTPDNDESQAEDYPKNAYTYFMKFDFVENEDSLENSLVSNISSPGENKNLNHSNTEKMSDELAVVQNCVETNDTVDNSNPTIRTDTKPGIVTSKDSKTLEELTLETSITLQNSKKLHDFLLDNINVKLYKTSTLLNTIPKPSDDAHCDVSLAPRPSKIKGSNTTIASIGKSASKSLSKSTASKMRPPTSAVPPAPTKEGKKDKKDKKAAEVTIYEWSKTIDVIGHAHVSCNLLLEGASIVSCFTPFRHPSSVKDEHSGNDVPCAQVVTETILDSEQIQIKVADHDNNDVTAKTNAMPVIQTTEYIDDVHGSKHTDEFTQGCFSIDESVPEAQIRLELTRWGSIKESLDWVAKNVKIKQEYDVDI